MGLEKEAGSDKEPAASQVLDVIHELFLEIVDSDSDDGNKP
jgi:hypothetical protein